MAEDLTPADVQAFTNGRLSATDPNTQILLDAALADARGFCGWYVSPVTTDTITIRGSGDRWLGLPTLNIVDPVSITETRYQDGAYWDPAVPPGSPQTVTLDMTTVLQDSDEPSALYRLYDIWHRSCRYQITYSHGFTAAQAADFRQAVLKWIDLFSQSIGQPGDGPVTDLKVDDVEVQWAAFRSSDTVLSNPLTSSPLYRYRLLPI